MLAGDIETEADKALRTLARVVAERDAMRRRYRDALAAAVAAGASEGQLARAMKVGRTSVRTLLYRHGVNKAQLARSGEPARQE